jgi:hypothetical protein
MTNGQDTTFDKKVEQLFFGVDVSNPSTELVDKFSKVTELIYRKHNEYVSYALMHNIWSHIFQFRTHPYLTNHFDDGSIELKVIENGKGSQVLDIWWKLKFDKKGDAIKVFDEIKNYFSQTPSFKKVYSSDLAIETAEFTDITSKKYPYIMFMLFDNIDQDKKYQIIFSLDNEMHYEK